MVFFFSFFFGWSMRVEGERERVFLRRWGGGGFGLVWFGLVWFGLVVYRILFSIVVVAVVGFGRSGEVCD